MKTDQAQVQFPKTLQNFDPPISELILTTHDDQTDNP